MDGLIYAPEKAETVTISTGQKKKKGLWSPKIVWTVTIIIIVLILLIGIIFLVTFEQETIEIGTQADVLNLDLLTNAEDALCCLEPASIIPTKRWLYEPSIDFTISLDKTDCSNVCTGLEGSNLTECENVCQGSDGEPKAIAHKGVAIYYAFSPGNMVNICQSFENCP